jgi:predicted phosphoribosyltransferase
MGGGRGRIAEGPMRLPFRDRHEAGRLLAAALAPWAGREDVVVLGLPRGGVVVAAEVAAALRAPLDAFVVRKLGLPGFEEVAMGAVASGGVRVLNRRVIEAHGVLPSELERVTAAERAEVGRREQAFRRGRPARDLRDRTVVVVDDGAATGATMRAAVTALRRHRPARIVVALPVASAEARRDFALRADAVVCLATPEPFHALGLFYERFPQVEDEEVCDLLAGAASGSGRDAAVR